MSIQKNYFGTMPDGREVYSYTLSNQKTEVVLIEYGARVAKLCYDGVSVVCGFDRLEGYLADTEYHGSTVGRYANRISEGKFSLDGVEYTLACNEVSRGEHLHGGNVGYSARVWSVGATESTEASDRVTFELVSPDGEEGYPGTLNVRVSFTLAGDALTIDYSAVSDKDTVINLTNHSYFNLSGVGDTILDHTLRMNVDHIVPVDSRLIPTGELLDVTGTPFDFRSPKTIGQDIRADHEQLAIAGGYDHCFVRNRGAELTSPEWIATISSPKSGITMEILTTEGGVQMYTGNFMNEVNPFFGTIEQTLNGAVALECNRMPDSPNQKAFPSPLLKAGEEYRQTTIYRFTK